MSLVGSLEDLGLGDILQIISMSQKSGVLTLRCEEGEGRIFLDSGTVRAACVKGGAEGLREVLLLSGALSESDYDEIQSTARSQGSELRPVLLAGAKLSAERLEELLRANLEAAVSEMFRWRTGDFSFEPQDALRPEPTDLFVSTGVSAQFLAMEGVRLLDEAAKSGGDATSGVEAIADASVARADSEPDVGATRVDVSESTTADGAIPVEVEGSAPATASTAPPIIVVDPELTTLEWMKQGLRPHFPRVHIFQRSELATARVRQYLGRAEVPLVLLSAEASDDRVTGAKGVAEIVARLRAHSPRLRILLLTADGSPTALPSELKEGVFACVKRLSAKEVRKKTAAGKFGDSVREAMQGGSSKPRG